jgi:hypothetical protein
LTKKVGTLSLEAQSKLEQDTVKKEKKAEAKADAEAKKLAASKVTIRRIERNKKKYVTAVQGLETFGEWHQPRIRDSIDQSYSGSYAAYATSTTNY